MLIFLFTLEFACSQLYVLDLKLTQFVVHEFTVCVSFFHFIDELKQFSLFALDEEIVGLQVLILVFFNYAAYVLAQALYFLAKLLVQLLYPVGEICTLQKSLSLHR